jgi:hypothetical protein
MARPDFPYTRLPGVRRTPITKATLWLGPDHILSVKSNRFAEEYRRFYYKDIQAIGAQRTKSTFRLACYSIVAGILLACLIGIFASGGNHPIWLGIVAALLFWTGWLLAHAPNCKCHLQTAVSVFELPSLSRIQAAERALPSIQERVEQAQGRLAPATPIVEPSAAPVIEPAPQE